MTNNTMNCIILTPGRYYQSRDGRIWGPMRVVRNLFHSNGEQWYRDGYSSCDKTTSKDLIQESKEPDWIDVPDTKKQCRAIGNGIEFREAPSKWKHVASDNDFFTIVKDRELIYIYSPYRKAISEKIMKLLNGEDK